MTTVEAIETVLNLAKAERDNSQEHGGNSVEAYDAMDEAIEVVERWLLGIKALVHEVAGPT